MRRVLVFLLLVAGLASGVQAADDQSPGDRARAREQVEFGVKVAQRGLWNEAIFRFERAVSLDPSYAAAHNNLAVAYERDGQLDKARAAYDKALELAPKNLHIKQNFDYFKEIHERAKGREAAPAGERGRGHEAGAASHGRGRG